MHRGYIKLWRKTLESPLWQNPKVWRLFEWCLIKASYKEHAQVVGYQEVILKPGELVFGRKTAARETGLTEQNIRTSLNILKSTNTLTMKTTNKYSIIQIQNWELYQDDNQQNNQQNNQQLTSNQPATNQQLTTNKKDKKDKKDKNNNADITSISGRYQDDTPEAENKNGKKPYGEFANVRLSDEEYSKLLGRLGRVETEFKIESLSGYMKSKGKYYKDHYATILSWRRKDEQEGKVKPEKPGKDEKWV